MRFIKYHIFAILFLSVPLFSQSRDEQILKGIDYVYQIKFDSASAIFQPLANNEPNDPTGYFFLAMIEWWKIYLNKEDESNDANYFSKVDKCVRICDDKLDKNERDDWAMFLKGGAIGYRGFLNAIRESWLKAVDDGREGLSLLQKSYEINPNNKDAVFGIGIYNYSFEYATDRYPILKTLLFFFPKGNKELGLAQLRDCAQNAKYAKTEANVTLCYIHLNFERNYFEALKYAQMLHQRYPDNPVFDRYLGKCYAGMADWYQTLNQWNSVQSKIDSSKYGYNNNFMKRETAYHLGLASFRMNDFDNAVKRYQQTIDLSKVLDKSGESNFQVFAVLGLGMISDVKGNRSEAIRYYDRVLEMKDVDNSHENAKKFKENPYR